MRQGDDEEEDPDGDEGGGFPMRGWKNGADAHSESKGKGYLPWKAVTGDMEPAKRAAIGLKNKQMLQHGHIFAIRGNGPFDWKRCTAKATH
jgi:hypothetical protein